MSWQRIFFLAIVVCFCDDDGGGSGNHFNIPNLNTNSVEPNHDFQLTSSKFLNVGRTKTKTKNRSKFHAQFKRWLNRQIAAQQLNHWTDTDTRAHKTAHFTLQHSSHMISIICLNWLELNFGCECMISRTDTQLPIIMYFYHDSRSPVVIPHKSK